MTNQYRVEVQDGAGKWSFGIRRENNLPQFCSVQLADTCDSPIEAACLKAEAARICGGTLRIKELV